MKSLNKFLYTVLVISLFSAVSIFATGNREEDIVENAAPEMQDYGWSAPGFSTDFSRMLIDPAGILSGGPPKDGIPAVDHPSYVSSEEAGEWLSDNEPVILVRIGNEARIYPIQILTWHEIVNDELGGVPLTVSFCPLCNTGVVFKRSHSGRVLDFGTTGRLRNSNLIMYDRQTESWWQQATGEAIIGELAGDSLDFHPSLTLSFAEALETAPTADVLSQNTGFSRPYGQNPYTGYDSPGKQPFLFQGSIDPEWDAMERVVVLMHNGEERIVAYSEVTDEGILQISIGGDPVVLLWTPDTASALDTTRISDGRTVGSLNAFLSKALGNDLVFSRISRDRFTDGKTGSIWTGSGTAVEGALAGEILEPIVSVQHFWFSAQAF